MPMIRMVLGALLLGATAASAGPPILHQTEAGFEEIATAVEDAIINAGLVIDNASRVGDMLARTRADVGSDKEIFAQARIFTFCSAVVSRRVMERDPQNIQFCPYAIFVYELADGPGQIVVGYRDYGADGLPEVQKLVDGIVRDALMLD